MKVVTTIALLAVLSFCSASAQQIALTFDDLPAHGPLPTGETRMQVVTSILNTLKASHVPPVYGFVNGVRVEEDPDTIRVLDAWRDAGYPLGNHSWSHMNLNDNSVEAMEKDVLRNETILQKVNAGEWKWYRYPYLAEGNTPEKHADFRRFLAEHHYRIAGVTMSFGDYAWNEPYARCRTKGDAAAAKRLEDSYLQAATQALQASRARAKSLFGHDIPYVLLMHLGAFDAHMLPRLLEQYKSQGVTFVTLEQAEADPFYVSDMTPQAPGTDTLEGALAEKHLPWIAGAELPAELNSICR